MTYNPIAVIAGLVIVALLLVWGWFLSRRKIVERPTETSSHYESGKGVPGSGLDHGPR